VEPDPILIPASHLRIGEITSPFLSFDNITNARPVNATLNGKRCATPFV
jgi:hypothetical protein